MCVCVCVQAIASQRKGIPESTTHVCVVPALRFAGGGNKKTARHLFGPLLPKGGGEFAQGGGLQKQTPAELIRATASGRGVEKTETRAAFVRASVAKGGGALNTRINT